MKTIRYIAIGLLWFTGLLHVMQITAAQTVDMAIVIAVTFGVIYLALGGLLLRGGRVIFWSAAILPLIGLALAALGMLMKPTLLGALFMAIDIGIAACGFGLLFGHGRKAVSL